MTWKTIYGQLAVGHDGIWTGFRTDMVLAPDAGSASSPSRNTGWFDPRGAPVPVADALVRSLLGLPEDAVRTDFPEHPEVWPELCGWYSFGSGAFTDPQPRMMLGAGVEVVVRHNNLVIRKQTPIPAVRRGLRLYPDGDDPYAFRLDVSALGPGTSRIVLAAEASARSTPCTSASCRCPYRSGPPFGTRDPGSTARSSPARPRPRFTLLRRHATKSTAPRTPTPR